MILKNVDSVLHYSLLPTRSRNRKRLSPLYAADMLSGDAHSPLMWKKKKKEEHMNVGQRLRLESTRLLCWKRLKMLFMLSLQFCQEFQAKSRVAWTPSIGLMYKTCTVAVRGQKNSPQKPRLACPHWSLRLVHLHGVWVRLASSRVLAHIHPLIWWELSWGEIFSPAAVFFTWKISSRQSGWLRLQLARIIWYQTFGMQRNKNWLFRRLPSFSGKPPEEGYGVGLYCPDLGMAVLTKLTGLSAAV